MGIINKTSALYLSTGVDQTGQYKKQTIEKMDRLISELFSTENTQEFIGALIAMQAEFRDTEAALKEFLESPEKVKELSGQLQDYSLKSVFKFNDLSAQTIRLLASGHAVKEIIELLDQLSAVAVIAGVPLEKTVELYNKVKSQDILTVDIIEEWQEVGVRIIPFLAKHFNVPEQDMAEKAVAGEIGFQELRLVLSTLTAPGGRFAGKVDEKMELLNGTMEVMQSSVIALFNRLAEKKGISFPEEAGIEESLAKNYEKIGQVLFALMAGFDHYRAALALNITMEKGWSAAHLANYQALLLMEKVNNNLTASSITDPFTMATSAVTTLTAALNTFRESANDFQTLFENFRTAMKPEKEKLDEVNSAYAPYMDELLTEDSTMAEIEKAEASANQVLVSNSLVQTDQESIAKAVLEIIVKIEQTLSKEIQKKADEAQKNKKDAKEKQAEAQVKEEEKKYKELLAKYGDYTSKRKLLDEEYKADLDLINKDLQDKGKESTDILLAERKKAYEKALADLDKSMMGPASSWTRLFGEAANYTRSQLKEIIENAQEVLEYVNNTPEDNLEANFGLSKEQLVNLKNNATELGTVYDALRKQLTQFARTDPFVGIISNFELLRRNTQEQKKAQEALIQAQEKGDVKAAAAAKVRIQKLEEERKAINSKMKEAVKTSSASLGEIGQAFQKIGDATGDAGLQSAGKLMNDVSAIGKSFAEGGPIAAGITAVTTGITAFFSSRAKYKAALKQMSQDQEAFAHKYKLSMSDIRLTAEEATNIFGEDSLRKAMVALQEMDTMYKDFSTAVKKDDKVQAQKSFLERFGFDRKELKDITTDLEGIKIVTRHKTWFRKEKSATLKELYPELFAHEEGFNVEAARVLLETNNQLNDEAKNQLQEVIDLYDQWQKAEDEFKSYLSSTFGEIGNGLGDSIIAAFENGTDAMDNWADSFNNVLKNLGKQLMQTLYFQQYFDELEEDLKELYTKHSENPDELGRSVTELMGTFFDTIGAVADDAAGWLYNFNEQAKEYGFDLFGSSANAQQSATSKGFETITQEQAHELNGRFTALQMAGEEIRIQNQLQTDEMKKFNEGLFEIKGATFEIKNITDELRTIHINSYLELMQISENTSSANKILQRMDANILAVKNNTSQL